MSTHHHERCGRCGCPNDHERKPCGRELEVAYRDDAGEVVKETRPCGCPNGIRSDVLLCQQLSKLIAQNDEIVNGVLDLGRILMFAEGVEVNEKGELQKAPKLHLV